jgi:hypothetical protein
VFFAGLELELAMEIWMSSKITSVLLATKKNQFGLCVKRRPLTLPPSKPRTTKRIGLSSVAFLAKASYQAWPLPSMVPVPLPAS